MATIDPTASPDALSLANNLQALHDAGHGWMDPTLQVHLATQGGSTQNMLTTADTYKNALNNTSTTISSNISDPSIGAKQDNIHSALTAVTNTHGAIPFSPESVYTIQQKMIANGQADSKLIPGTWNPAWQQAWNNAGYAKLTAPGKGNVDSFKLFKSVLNEFGPSTWAPTLTHAITSFVFGMGKEARQLIADQAGEIAGEFKTNSAGALAGQQTQANVTSSVENALGGKTTSQGIALNEAQRNWQDMGNLLSLLVLGSAGKGMFSAVGKIGEGLSGTAVEGGTTTKLIAGAKALLTNPSKLVTNSLPEEFANVPRLTIVKSLANAAENSAAGITKFNPLSILTSPINARIAPFLLKMASEDGIYFAGKQAIANTMRNPIRAGLSAIQNRGALAGLGLLGVSDVENKLNAQPIFDANKVKPYQGVLGLALNVLSAGAGASPETLKLSESIGKTVSAAHETTSNTLGPIGFDSVVKQALGIKLKDLQNGVGEPFVNDHFIRNKLPQYAASHLAQQSANLDVWSGKIDRGSQEYKDLIQSYENEIMRDPELHAAATESLINNPAQWAQMMRNDHITQFGNLIRRNGVAKKDQSAFFDALNELKTGPYQASHIILDPEIRNLFHGSSAIRAVEDLRSHQLSQEFGKTVPPYSDSNFLNVVRPDKRVISTSPSLVTLHRSVNEFAPDSSKLARNTKYGNGIVATQDSSIAGRGQANVFALRHADKFDEPNFIDLTKADRTKELAVKIRDNFATRDELGLAPAGQKTDITPEYKTLRNLLNKPRSTTGQKILDAYRSALKAGGKLNNDEVDQRMDQLTKQFMQENNITGMKYLDNKFGPQFLLRPEKAIANLVAADPSLSKDTLMASYLTHTNFNGPGTLGWARKDSIMAQDAVKASKNVFAQLRNAGYGAEADAAQSTLELEAISKQRGITMDTTPLPRMTNVAENPKLIQITKDAIEVLTKKFGLSTQELTRLDPIQLASLMWRESRTRASEAYFPNAAPEGVNAEKFANAQAEIARMDAKGWRPVQGTDIGHGYEIPTLPEFAIAQRTSLLRKAAMRSGTDLTKYSDLSVANTRRNNIVDRLNERLGKDVTPIQGDNGDAIYSRLIQAAQSGLFTKENRLEQAVREGQQDKLIKRLIGKNQDQKDFSQIRDEYNTLREQQIAIHNQAHQVRDMSLTQMAKALERSPDPGDITGIPIPGYSKEDAIKLAKDVITAYADTPASMVGISKIEDMFRASGAMLSNQTASFFGKAPLLKNFKIGEGPLINTLASLPNDLTRLRDKWRFDLNPIFSARRLAKTNVKAALEGVPATMNPYLSLNRMGKVDDAMATLNRTMPDVYKAAKDLEPLDKMLLQNDIWNIYNPGHQMLWQAYHLEKMGKSDSEINALLTKINTYGDRTPLERSINTIFYPFSFNKTLYRNVGGYIMDNPGHAMLLDAAFSLYSHYNKNNAIGQWVDNHAPLLKEFQKLNAFEHGTGLGQLGGINAPYLNEIVNLFSPQRITPANATDAIKTMTNMIPALSELNTILFNYQSSTHTSNLEGTGVETAKVGFWALKNLEQRAKDLYNHQKRIAYQPMMTDQAQIIAAEKTVNMLKVQLAGLMNTNATWPDDPSVPVILRPVNGVGKKYTASSFKLFAQYLYPSYNPTAGTSIALEKNNEAANYVAKLNGTPRYSFYSQFQAIANTAIQKLHKTNDPSTIQNIVDPLRTAATYMAESDKQFLSFYNKFYESSLGPIEGLSK